MFTRKKNFSNRLKFTKNSLEQIIKKLKEGGFTEFSIKIPKSYTIFKKNEFTTDEFISLNYNFVSQILLAKSSTDTIKILFTNNTNSKANFDDTIFPSSTSELSKYYIESKDPVRIVGLIDFIDTLLEENSVRGPFMARFQNYLIFFSSIYLLLFVSIFLSFFDKNIYSPWLIFQNNILILSFIFIFSIFYIFFHIINPGGLYLNKFEHPIVSFAKRIFMGDFKDNLIISFLVFVAKLIFAGFFVNILWAFFGDTLINAIKFLPSLINKS